MTDTPKKPPARKLIAQVMSRPWAVRRAALENAFRIAFRENASPEAVALELGRPLQNTRAVTMRGSVAVVPITGPIFRYANVFTEISGGTSLELLALDLGRALSDPAVKSIVLEVDSPGGEAIGIHELARAIRLGSSSKRIVAYVGGEGCSAAYWLAAGASEVVVDATAMLGSIGVVFCVPRTNPESASEIEIVSSQSPRKRPDLSTEEGVAEIQAIADRLAEEFIGDVAELRGVPTSRVLELAGGVAVGSDAVEVGLADRLGSLESLIAELNASPGGPSPKSASVAPTRRTAQKGTPTVIRPATDAPTEPNAADAPPPPDPNAPPPAQDGEGGPAFAVGDRVTALVDHNDVPAGTHGEVVEVNGNCYAVLFDGQASPSKWWMQEELEPEQMDATAAALLKVTGAKTVAQALAMAGGHGRAGAKALAEAKAKADAEQRTRIVADLRASKKATAAQAKWLSGLPLDVVQGFAATAMAHPTLAAEEPKEPEVKDSLTNTHNGKTWEQLRPQERAELYQTNHALYQAMKAAAERPGA